MNGLKLNLHSFLGLLIYVSGMSAKSRGYDEKLLDGYSAEFVMPDVLIEESIKADSVLCY